MKVICQICGKEFDRINNLHLKIHNISYNDYRIRFPNCKIISDEFRELIKQKVIGFKHSEKSKVKMSKIKIGHQHSDETKRKIGNGNRGKIISEEVRKKISKNLKGKFCGKNNPNYGKQHSEEIRKRISKSRKGKLSGEKHPLWNKHHSEESKLKNSKAHIGLQLGSKNGMYGKHHSEETKKKISQANWINGSSFEPYCHKFNESLKNEIRERDNYQCQHPECLCTQLESLILYKKSLSVHHIHYDKKNCYPDLITLCNNCNSYANKNRKYWEELYMNILNKRNLLNWKIKGDKQQWIF